MDTNLKTYSIAEVEEVYGSLFVAVVAVLGAPDVDVSPVNRLRG